MTLLQYNILLSLLCRPVIIRWSWKACVLEKLVNHTMIKHTSQGLRFNYVENNLLYPKAHIIRFQQRHYSALKKRKFDAPPFIRWMVIRDFRVLINNNFFFYKNSNILYLILLWTRIFFITFSNFYLFIKFLIS